MNFIKFGRVIEIAAAILLTLLAIAFVVHRTGDAAEQGQGKLAVSAAWARPPAGPGAAGAVYMTIANEGAGGDKLIGASSPAAQSVEVHVHEHEGGVMRMRHLPEGVAIPSGKETIFAPGGLHLMLIGLTAPLNKGDSFPVELKFRDAGMITVTVKVGMTPPLENTRGSHH